MMEQPAYNTERRSGTDRRARRFRNIRWLLKKGQRRHVRRESDRHKLQELDAYPTDLFIVVILVLGLSVVDGVLTLWLVDNGATELNPVMAYYLEQGPQVFMAAKYLITAAVVTIVVAFNHAFLHFLKIRFGQLLKVFAGCFAMVVVWELFLMVHLVL